MERVDDDMATIQSGPAGASVWQLSQAGMVDSAHLQSGLRLRLEEHRHRRRKQCFCKPGLLQLFQPSSGYALNTNRQ